MAFLNNPDSQSDFEIWRYQNILCKDFPDFLEDYIRLPIMRRLGGVGLLCGTDWTPLFHNKFFYSRLDHSIGVALIVWNFTRDKKQTLAALFHDIATPAFSHVNDFRNGDALLQESTEKSTKQIINDDVELSELLFKQGIYKYEIDDYHKFPIADNDLPGLSADRLEYMFPSGAALDGIWTMDDIETLYKDITVLTNEAGQPELGFKSEIAAVQYTKRFLKTSHILQYNEDKVAMQMLADILTMAIDKSYISEKELYVLDEEYIIASFDKISSLGTDPAFTRLYHTFRHMKTVQHTMEPLQDAYCISLEVKKRFVDPLVLSGGRPRRISLVSLDAACCIKDFLNFSDTPYACVCWT